MIDYELELFDRIEVIKQVVAKYGEDKFYLSFSGGKDSTALHYLLDKALPNNKIPRVFMNTGLEFLAVVKFVKALAEKDDRIVIVNSKIPVRKSLDENGYPFKNKEFSRYADIYWRKGFTKSTKRYYEHKGMNAVPEKLKYIFSNECPIHISDKCCEIRKEKPIWAWAREHNRPIALVALVGGEGGRRDAFSKDADGNVHCFVTKTKYQQFFYPLRKVDGEFVNEFIKREAISLCELYYPPFNFTRTGCKGCPFGIDLQRQLELIEDYFPNEYKQCELVWKPVYDEYRRIGYRLTKKNRQLSLFGHDTDERSNGNGED